MDAAEAHRLGLVSRIVPPEHWYDEALKVARSMATMPPIALRIGKEAVNKAFELTIADGVVHERRLFSLLFATEDQKEGMAAFAEKRQPEFKGR